MIPNWDGSCGSLLHSSGDCVPIADVIERLLASWCAISSPRSGENASCGPKHVERNL